MSSFNPIKCKITDIINKKVYLLNALIKSPLTLYPIEMPLKYHVFENIMENGAFALLEQMLHFQ